MTKYKVYSIVYRPEQVSEYYRYDNSRIKTPEQKSYLFEYNPIVDILDNHIICEDYLGIFSHKFCAKTGIFKKRLFNYLGIFPNYDVYSFSKFANLGTIISNLPENSHPGFGEIFFPVCEDLGLPTYFAPDLVYENFFIAKTDIYRSYISDIIKPAIDLLEGKYKSLAWRNAKYLQNNNLLRDTGLSYYTFHTFVLERLLNQYIEKNKLSVKCYFNSQNSRHGNY